MDLSNKTAVITGAAGGIGLGIARACLAKGMKVVISDLDAERLATTADALRSEGGEVADHACDVRDVSSVDALRDASLAAFGQVDLVCNNAGIGLTRPLLECGDADWELLLGVNQQGVINGVRTFLPLMTERGTGHLSATASLSGLVGDPDLTVYNASKFAVVGLMEALALELHRDHPGVTTSVLCPGPVATDLIASSDANLVSAGAASMVADERTADITGYLAAGMHPDAVGQLAVDGIAADDFWLISHPDLTFELLDARLAAMRNNKLHVPRDWATEQ